ncbi:hypothetical protein BpHYR1_020983 [Brachionus plicatilis]|uniref:Uncharacterized protein n=1 Tax=Brachionus plicatilis TaxID=10195 RepID=A0A3M7T1H8_BRAPC|nr:hypothetical protein BpHYR1_020983 [Brachionus plicatilis]
MQDLKENYSPNNQLSTKRLLPKIRWVSSLFFNSELFKISLLQKLPNNILINDKKFIRSFEIKNIKFNT